MSYPSCPLPAHRSLGVGESGHGRADREMTEAVARPLPTKSTPRPAPSQALGYVELGVAKQHRFALLRSLPPAIRPLRPPFLASLPPPNETGGENRHITRQRKQVACHKAGMRKRQGNMRVFVPQKSLPQKSRIVPQKSYVPQKSGRRGNVHFLHPALQRIFADPKRESGIPNRTLAPERVLYLVFGKLNLRPALPCAL